MLDAFKNSVDYISNPTISFSLLTVLTPLLFPPTDWFDKINRKLRFASYLSLHYISAKERKGLKKLLTLADKIYQSSVKDLDTSILNKILKVALSNQQPSMSGRFRPKPVSYTHLTLPTILLV